MVAEIETAVLAALVAQVDQLAHDRIATLKACCLVSRAWRDLAQPILFRNVRSHVALSAETDLAPLLFGQGRLPPAKLAWTQSLTLTDEQSPYDPLLGVDVVELFVESLRGLTCLTLGNVGSTVEGELLDLALLTRLPHLTSFTLDSTDFLLSRSVTLPSLTRLAVHTCTTDKRSLERFLVHSSLPRLAHVAITGSQAFHPSDGVGTLFSAGPLHWTIAGRVRETLYRMRTLVVDWTMLPQADEAGLLPLHFSASPGVLVDCRLENLLPEWTAATVGFIRSLRLVVDVLEEPLDRNGSSPAEPDADDTSSSSSQTITRLTRSLRHFTSLLTTSHPLFASLSLLILPPSFSRLAASDPLPSLLSASASRDIHVIFEPYERETLVSPAFVRAQREAEEVAPEKEKAAKKALNRRWTRAMEAWREERGKSMDDEGKELEDLVDTGGR